MDLENLIPKEVEDFKIDLVSLRSDLKDDEFNALLDYDGNVDIYELLENYSLKYIRDQVWVRVKEYGVIICEVSAHDILTSLFDIPQLFEGVEIRIVSKHLCMFSSFAQGQGGGLAIIDINSGDWVFKSLEFSVQHLISIPSHSIFVCLNNVETYSWHSIDLVLIKFTGEWALLNLYSHDHFNDKRKYDASDLAILNNVDESGGREESEECFSYSSEDDVLHLFLNGHWNCKCQEVIDLANFEKG